MAMEALHEREGYEVKKQDRAGDEPDSQNAGTRHDPGEAME